MPPKKPFLIGVSTLAATIALTSQVALAGSLLSFPENETSLQRLDASHSQVSPLMLFHSNGPISRPSDHGSHGSHGSHISGN